MVICHCTPTQDKRGCLARQESLVQLVLRDPKDVQGPLEKEVSLDSQAARAPPAETVKPARAEPLGRRVKQVLGESPARLDQQGLLAHREIGDKVEKLDPLDKQEELANQATVDLRDH